MKNFRGRRTPINIRNNVRLEPTSVLIISTSPTAVLSETNEIESYEASFGQPENISHARLSSIILPTEVTSVTSGATTYYQSRKGAWKVKFSKFEQGWSADATKVVKLTLDREVVEDDLKNIIIQFIVACRTNKD